MREENTPPSRYKVSWLHSASSQLAALTKLALGRGLAAKMSFAHEVQTILRALEFAPLEWSEPIVDLPLIGLTMCAGFHQRLKVIIGVHQEQRVVFVKSIVALPGHALADAK